MRVADKSMNSALRTWIQGQESPLQLELHVRLIFRSGNEEMSCKTVYWLLTAILHAYTAQLGRKKCDYGSEEDENKKKEEISMIFIANMGEAAWRKQLI